MHGTSTQINDLTEAVALSKLFPITSNPIYVTAQKSYIGHLLGAASAVEIAGALLMMKYNFLPKICNLDKSIDELTLKPVLKLIDDVDIKNVLKISSSFSGIHTAIVLSKFHN